MPRRCPCDNCRTMGDCEFAHPSPARACCAEKAGPSSSPDRLRGLERSRRGSDPSSEQFASRSLVSKACPSARSTEVPPGVDDPRDLEALSGRVGPPDTSGKQRRYLEALDTSVPGRIAMLGEVAGRMVPAERAVLLFSVSRAMRAAIKRVRPAARRGERRSKGWKAGCRPCHLGAELQRSTCLPCRSRLKGPGGWRRCSGRARRSPTWALATTTSELRSRGGFRRHLCHPLRCCSEILGRARFGPLARPHNQPTVPAK